MLQHMRQGFEALLEDLVQEGEQEAGWNAENNNMSDVAMEVPQASAGSCMQADILPKLC